MGTKSSKVAEEDVLVRQASVLSDEDDASYSSGGASSEMMRQMRRINTSKASVTYSTGAVELVYAFLSQRGFDPDGRSIQMPISMPPRADSTPPTNANTNVIAPLIVCAARWL